VLALGDLDSRLAVCGPILVADGAYAVVAGGEVRHGVLLDSSADLVVVVEE